MKRSAKLLLIAMACAWGLVLLSGAPTIAQQAAPAAAESAAALEQEVGALVKDLDAPTKARRDDAEKKLLELGPPALAHLPACDGQSAEVAMRLSRIRNELERVRASTAIEPSRITLKGTDLPLAKVIEELARQSGNSIVDYRAQFGQPADELKLSADVKDLPFWQAIDQLLDSSALTVYPFPRERSLALVAADPGAPPRTGKAVYAGAFRIEPLRIVAQRQLDEADRGSLRLALAVMWEPRLRPILITQSSDDIQATLDDGRPLATDVMGQTEVALQGNQTAAELPMVFELPPRSTSAIKQLRGRLLALVPSPNESFRFDRIAEAKGTEQRQGHVRVVLEAARKNGEIWEIRVRVVFERPFQALESHRTWVLDNKAYLLSKSGEKIPFVGYEKTRETSEEVGLAYLFDVPGAIDDYSLVYETPTSILSVPLEYELSNIPLP